MAKELTPELLHIPKRLDDLPTPPEVVACARAYKKKLGLVGAKVLKEIEDEMKLQYYYGGWYVRYLTTEQGVMVVALLSGDEEEYARQVQALSPEDRQRSVVDVPSPWMDEMAWLPSCSEL